MPPEDPQAASVSEPLITATAMNIWSIDLPLRDSDTENPGRVPGRVCTTQKLARALLIRLSCGERPRGLSETVSFGRQPDEGLLHSAYESECSTERWWSAATSAGPRDAAISTDRSTSAVGPKPCLLQSKTRPRSRLSHWKPVGRIAPIQAGRAAPVTATRESQIRECRFSGRHLAFPPAVSSVDPFGVNL